MILSETIERRPQDETPEVWREGGRWLGIILAAFAFVLFWHFRAAELNGGDSDQWCREIEQGNWFRKRQMLSFAFMQLNYVWTHALWQWNGRLAINLSSCLAGACFIYLLWRLLGGMKPRAGAMALVLTSGFVQLYFGHLETYANSMACLVFFFLTVRRYLCGRRRMIHVAAAYSLGTAFHQIFWFLSPLFLVFLYHSEKRFRDIAEILYGLSPAILLTWLMNRYTTFGGGEMVGNRFIPLLHVDPGAGKRYALISWAHLQDWLWFAGNACHLTIVLVLLGLIARRFRRSVWSDLLWMCLLCFLGFTFIWHPDAGRRDWDLFSFAGLPMALLAIEALRWDRARWFASAAWVSVAVSAFLLAGKVTGAARLGARGDGAVLVNVEVHDGYRVATINLNGYSKTAEMHHILEGRHKVSVYLARELEIVRYDEIFDLHPGDIYEIDVPDVFITGQEQVP